MNYKNILFYLGIFSLLVSILSLFNTLYSIYFDFNLGMNTYVITFSISSVIGFVCCYTGRQDYKNIAFIEQIAFVFFGFLFIPLLISIPYYLSIYGITFLDSPNSTSSVAYTLFMKNQTSSTSCRACHNNTNTTVTLMEIAGWY